MNVLFLTDRISFGCGADLHLRQVIEAVAEQHEVVVGHGGHHGGATVPKAVRQETRLRCLAAAKRNAKQLDLLTELVADADVVHLQNVMNPAAIEVATATGRAVATVQDHRVFCPGRGKRTARGGLCREPMNRALCASCFDEKTYADAIFELTTERRNALHKARRLVVLSQYMANELAAVGLANGTVIPPWVKTGGAPIAGKALLVAGRLVSHKAVGEACRAWKQSGVPRELLVAGDGPLAAEADDLGAELLGWLSPKQLRGQLHEALALLLPSGWEEPFGIVGVEALAEGTPVILMGSGGTQAWSDHGCLSVSPGDTAAMAAAIRALDANPSRAVALGEQGQAMVKRRFARERLLPSLLKLYGEVACCC